MDGRKNEKKRKRDGRAVAYDEGYRNERERMKNKNAIISWKFDLKREPKLKKKKNKK